MVVGDVDLERRVMPGGTEDGIATRLCFVRYRLTQKSGAAEE
jgi:hypothetical protein